MCCEHRVDSQRLSSPGSVRTYGGKSGAKSPEQKVRSRCQAVLLCVSVSHTACVVWRLAVWSWYEPNLTLMKWIDILNVEAVSCWHIGTFRLDCWVATVPRDCVFICLPDSVHWKVRMDDWVPSSLGVSVPLRPLFWSQPVLDNLPVEGSVEMRIHPLLHWKEKALWILAGFSNWKIHISLSQLDCVGICLYTGSQVKSEPGMWSEFWWEAHTFVLISVKCRILSLLQSLVAVSLCVCACPLSLDAVTGLLGFIDP